MKSCFTALLIALSGWSVAHAQHTAVGVNFKAGTAGAGFDLTVPFSDKLNLRLGHANYKTDRAVTEEGVDYQAQLVLGGTNALLDWFPSKASSFRWTLGAYAPKHHLTGQAQASEGGTIEINNVDYPAALLGKLDLSVQWGGTRPYLGLGFDGFRSARSGLYYNLDAGVIFSGSPKVSLRANCPNAQFCEALASDLKAEEANIRSTFKPIQYLPIIQVGVGYRF
jgi:hypothetical protein